MFNEVCAGASSISAGIPGEDEADSVVDPPLDDLEESPPPPPPVGPDTESIRLGDGGEVDGAAWLNMPVGAVDVISASVADKFFCAFNVTLYKINT